MAYIMNGKTFRIKKPYDKKILEAMNTGSSFLDINKKEKPDNYGGWLYLARKGKKTKAFEIRTVKHNLFMVKPKKKLEKNKTRRESKYYTYFNII